MAHYKSFSNRVITNLIFVEYNLKDKCKSQHPYYVCITKPSLTNQL